MPTSYLAPSGTRPAAELTAWRNAVFIIFVVSGLGLSTWMSRIPGVRDELGLSTSAVGLVIVALAGGSILGLVASAVLLARLGSRRGMILTLCVAATGLIVVGVGSTFFASVLIVAVGLALIGFGIGSTDVMMNVEGAAAEREIGKTLMPLMHACFSFGTVIGAGIGAAAIAVRMPLAWHFLIIAIIIALAAVISVRSIPLREALGDPVPGPHANEAGTDQAEPWTARLRSALSVWADLKLVLIGVVMLGMAFAEGSASDWLPLAVVDGHHQDNVTGAIMFGVFMAAMTTGRVVGGPVVDRVGRVASIRITAALGVAGLLMFILAPTFWMVVVGTVLWGFGASLGFPLGMSAAADGGKNAAARVSAVAMIGYCAFLVGPPLIGFLGQTIGLLNALYFILALMLLAGLCAPAVRKPARA
ncbi:MAG: MFS transporter [Microbacteriaceae bacterium]